MHGNWPATADTIGLPLPESWAECRKGRLSVWVANSRGIIPDPSETDAKAYNEAEKAYDEAKRADEDAKKG